MKCPRIVTENFKDEAGETRVRTYVRGRPLGKGGFAVVYSMQDPSTGRGGWIRVRSTTKHTVILQSKRNSTDDSRYGPCIKQTDTPGSEDPQHG